MPSLTSVSAQTRQIAVRATTRLAAFGSGLALAACSQSPTGPTLTPQQIAKVQQGLDTLVNTGLGVN